MDLVYVVDDEPAMAKAIGRVLEAEDRDIRVYIDAAEALRDAREQRPHLVVTDISMPGLHGLDFIRGLREDFPPEDLPIVVVSAVGVESTIDAAYEEGADDYILKPFNTSELRVKARLHLGRAHQREPGAARVGKGIGTFASYELVRIIGEGGMGTIYEAREMATGDVVALKVLSEEYLRDEEYRDRFLREAQILKDVDHENIVHFYEYRAFKGQPYISMEYVDGPDVDAYVDAHGPMPEKRTLHVARQVLEALSYLYRRGLIHRDVKPHNLLLGSDGVVKVADFGLARHRTHRHLTQKGIIIGTLDYLSPEQIRGGVALDIRTDLFSLGTTMYFMLAGHLPFEEYDENEVADRILEKPYPDLEHEGVSRDTARVIELFTKKDREDRPRNPREAIALVDEALGN